MLRVTPLYGSKFSEKGEAAEPSCTLFEFSDCRCLINVGWHVDLPDLPDHDCVLLTDSTLQALGGLPVYFEQRKAKQKSVPIYATFPTVKMGQMTLYDQHAAIAMDGGRPPYSLQAVDDVFASIRAIKYSQKVLVTPANGTKPALSVCAHLAGHVVGGAFFVIERLQDETVAVFTEVYHIADELLLDSASLTKYASTPDVLITIPGGPAFRQLRALPLPTTTVTRPEKDLTERALPRPKNTVTRPEKDLTETVLSVLRRDGNVLMPVDCSGRVLELVLLLNQLWEKDSLQAAYNLVWLAPMCQNVAEFARSQLEWMASLLGTQFDSGEGHPLQLNAVQFCTSVAELNAVIDENQNPTCVLASGLSLEGGPARDVFLKWADNADNAVVFTDSSHSYLRHVFERRSHAAASSLTGASKDEGEDAVVHSARGPWAAAPDQQQSIVVPPDGPESVLPEQEEEDAAVGDVLTESSRSPWTTAGQLLRSWAKAKAMGAEMDDTVLVDVNVPVKSPLAGPELKAFLAQEESARLAMQQAEEKRALLAQVELAKGQLHLGEDDTETPKVSAAVSTVKMARPRKKSRFDSTLFLKFSKPLHCMSPGLFACTILTIPSVTFEVREEAVGLGQDALTAMFGIGESTGNTGVVQDDYGIAVKHERFTDIVSGVDPSKLAGGTGRIGEDVLRRGFGYGVDGAAKVSGTSRTVSEDEDHNDGGGLDEQALEAEDLSEGNGIIRGRNGRLPTKVGTVPRKLEVLAEVTYIPGLEGRVSGKAARQSVRALQPREVIILGGPKSQELEDKGGVEFSDELALLKETAKSTATGSKNILTPSDGETSEMIVGHAAYSVRLIDTPYQIAAEKEATEAKLEAIEPFEAKLGVCNVGVVDCVATGQRVAADDSIVLAPRYHVATGSRQATYLSDGDVLLHDLRAELIASGLKAQYNSHAGYTQLLVNGKLLVRKDNESGKIYIEGPLCEDFYAVRAIVCGKYLTL